MEHGLEEARGSLHVAALHADVDELVERQHVRLHALRLYLCACVW